MSVILHCMYFWSYKVNCYEMNVLYSIKDLVSCFIANKRINLFQKVSCFYKHIYVKISIWLSYTPIILDRNRSNTDFYFGLKILIFESKIKWNFYLWYFAFKWFLLSFGNSFINVHILYSNIKIHLCYISPVDHTKWCWYEFNFLFIVTDHAKFVWE